MLADLNPSKLLEPAREKLISLRSKITIFLTIFLAGTFVLLSSMIMQLERQHFVSETRADVNTVMSQYIRAIDATWDPALTVIQNRKNMSRVSGLRASLEDKEQIVYAVFQDPAGKVQYFPKKLPGFGWMTTRTSFSMLVRQELALTGTATRTFAAYPEGYVTEFLAVARRGNGKPMGVVRLGFLETEVQHSLSRFTRSTLRWLILMNILATFAGCLLAYMAAEKLERPIQSLHQRARTLLDPESAPANPGNVLVQLAEEFEGIESLVNRLRGHRMELVSTLSHEFRSPLQAIRGYVDFLQHGGAGPVSREINRCLAIIGDTADHFQYFIDNILDLAKLDNERLVFEISDFSAKSVIEKAVELFVEEARKSGVSLAAEPALATDSVRGDFGKTFRVLINLISNALKFTPAGGAVRVGAVSRDGFVEFYVSDNGPGIAPGQREKVFEEFYQASGSEETTGPKGLGIGLTLCKRMIEAQGGKIWIDGDVGTTVRFTVAKTAKITRTTGRTGAPDKHIGR